MMACTDKACENLHSLLPLFILIADTNNNNKVSIPCSHIISFIS